jgi:4-amino-4-deoxy-L-arabinose transferase-like glycosyltransferase
VISKLLKHNSGIWVLGALIIAFALRVYRLDAQSLWNDEGTSVALAPLSLPAIASAALQDIHPPLYYFLLHFWMPFAGNTEFAVRFLSVAAGVLVIAVSYRIARSMFDLPTAILAALLSAFSPFQVYYSQETRMYIWVTLFAAVSVYAMLRMLDIGRETRNPSLLQFWLLYVAATVAMLYTQYVGAFVLLAENLIFLVWLVLEWHLNIRRVFAFWVGAQILVGLAFGPWYLLAGNQLASWPSISEPFDLPTLLWRLLNVFSVGLTWDTFAAMVVALAFGVLVLAGFWPGRDRRTGFNLLLAAAWLLVPIGVMYIVSLARPAYNPKFLLLATPPFFILAARGVEQLTIHRSFALGPLAFIVAGLVLAGSSVPSLFNYFFAPRYARDDYRAILRYVDANAREGDGILVDAPGQVQVVRYYARGEQSFFLLPRMRPPDPTATREDVDAMLGKVKRLYAIYWATTQSDPQNIVEMRLAEKAFKAEDEWHGDVRLAVYGVAPASPGVLKEVNLKVGDDLALAGVRLDGQVVHAGDIVTVTLDWRVLRAPATRYKIFVHLLDGAGQVVAQRDGEPVGDLRMTTTWQAGESVVDHYGILIEPDMPPGEYRLEIGMYRADNGARLAMRSQDGQPVGDHLILGTLQIVK